MSRDECLITDNNKKSQHLPTRVVNPVLYLLSQSFTAIFIILSVVALVHAQHASAVIEEGAAELRAPEQRRSDGCTSFSVSTSWHFSLSSINQTP